MRVLNVRARADDCIRIVGALAQYGYEVTLTEAEYYWEKYSADRCAGWLLTSDGPDCAQDIYDALRSYLWEGNTGAE